MSPGTAPAEPIAGALIAVLVAFHAVWLRTVTLRGWSLIDGTVVAFKARPFDGEDGPSTILRPMISTLLPDGETLTFEADMGSDPNPWSVGDAVLVRVKGEKVKLHCPSFFNSWHIFMLIFAVVMLTNGSHYSPHDRP